VFLRFLSGIQTAKRSECRVKAQARAKGKRLGSTAELGFFRRQINGAVATDDKNETKLSRQGFGTFCSNSSVFRGTLSCQTPLAGVSILF
jgi:hypothetical protein